LQAYIVGVVIPEEIKRLASYRNMEKDVEGKWRKGGCIYPSMILNFRFKNSYHMKATFQILIFSFLIALLVGCKRYKVYQPLEFNGHKLVERPDLLTEEHISHLSQVLDYYQVRWKEEGGNVFISSQIDQEMIWNFTSKANDPEWLKTHRVTD